MFLVNMRLQQRMSYRLLGLRYERWHVAPVDYPC
jgi:hypothetical protein